MKKTFLVLLCLSLMLSGCGVSSNPPVQTEPIQTDPPATQASISPIPLLEQGIVSDESPNLLYIPNETVEQMIAPEVRLLGHGLLLSECTDDAINLNLISLEDGSLVASGTVPGKAGTKLYIGSGEIGLCDRESGQISILDEQFHSVRAYDVPGEGDDWYLNSELDTLYIFFSDRGLLARNLVTGEDLWLVDNGFRVNPIGSSNGYVFFEYTDRADQKTHTRCLNLSMATLETLPLSDAITGCIRQGETWLLRSSETDGLHILAEKESAQSFLWSDSEVRLLSPKQHLLATDPSGRRLTLFETDGDFLSQCALPISSHNIVGKDFIWSGYWEGYFFTDFIDSSIQLMFWDVNAHCEGENLQMQPLEQIQQPQNVVEAALYERAAQLSQRFGVDIRIAEQCSLDYTHYDSYALTDPNFIRSALDILESSLSNYPEGFFRQLTFDTVETVRFELVGNLNTKDGFDTLPPSAGGFAQNLGSYYLIALDGYALLKQTVFHEISHVIDARLKWDSMIREDALFSEDAWLALQPEGFHYAKSYTEIPEELLHFMESMEARFFIGDYALTYPTEDRAQLMESAMENYTWDFEPGSGTRAKLQYYADCIRDCFDTDGWPETTSWEQVLQ